MDQKGALRQYTSLAMTLAVILVLLLASPAQAILLGLDLPATGDIDATVDFELSLDIEEGERIPIDNVTLVVDGPSGHFECVFLPDGTPLTGCTPFTIGPDDNADNGSSDRYGNGWNGSTILNTTFGYGYGFGYGFGFPGSAELIWDIHWNTTGFLPGDYDVDFFVSSSSAIADRIYGRETPGTITLDGVAALLSVKPPFPQGNDYVFVCDALGFTPTSYSWKFGDGQKLLGISNDNVWHTFTSNGDFLVECTATDGVHTATDTLLVHAGTGPTSAELFIKPFFPQGPNYVFVCDAKGFTATEYDWYFGDGQKLLGISNGDVWHTYAADGPYDVMCVARNNGIEESAQMHIEVAGASGAVDLRVKSGFPQGQNYVLECDADFPATSYDWFFGDGQKLLGISNDNVWHTYAPGSYDAKCTARNGATTAMDTLHIDVS